MENVMHFGEILEAADKLSVQDQESLLDILHRRLIERRREEIAGDIREAREALKAGRGDDLTLHLYLGMAYSGKATADPGHGQIWENLAFLEFQRVQELDPAYRLASGIFSEKMMGLFDRARATE